MDRRSWLWRRKSAEKSPGETESSGSVSSISERYLDDQEGLRASPVSASPNYAQSPDVSSKIVTHEVHETVNNEKLSAALLCIGEKEELAREHAKVAEEAVAGWERAENEVAALKQQLEAKSNKNSALQDRIGHLDGALKECVRQLRQSREDQEKKFQETVVKMTNEWESQKRELETRVTELQARLEARKTEATISIGHDLHLKLQALEKENSALRTELITAFDNLQMKTLEKEQSTRAAETASKQHLKSIKKVAKLEAECRRLRAATKRSSPSKENKLSSNSICTESFTDSQSDCGERLLAVDNQSGCSDSLASALIIELDQFTHDKVLKRNLTSSVEIDLMDDFLEMEKLAASPKANFGSGSELDAGTDLTVAKRNPSRDEFEALRYKMDELEFRFQKTTHEKHDMEKALAETRSQLRVSGEQLMLTEDKLVKLQWQLNSANGSKHAFELEAESLESRRKELESQLQAANFEVEKLKKQVDVLEGKVEEERNLSAELAAKCQNMDAIEAERIGLESKLLLAQLEQEEFQVKIGSLEAKIEEQKALSAGLTAKVDNLMKEREALRSQLEASQVEAGKLKNKTRTLEEQAKAEKVLSAELRSDVVALETKKDKLSSLLQSAQLETVKLTERATILEQDVKAERELSSDLAARCKHLEALEANREETESKFSLARMEINELCQKVCFLEGKIVEQIPLQTQHESTRLKVGELHEKVNSLEKEIEEERNMSAEFAANCQRLKDELARMKLKVELQQPTSTKGVLNARQLEPCINRLQCRDVLEKFYVKMWNTAKKLRKQRLILEREFALAAGKVAECQSTIASISRQLKSLADFDLMLESGETELDDEENLNIPNGLRPSSAFSPLPEFEKCLSPSRNYMHIRSH